MFANEGPNNGHCQPLATAGWWDGANAAPGRMLVTFDWFNSKFWFLKTARRIRRDMAIIHQLCIHSDSIATRQVQTYVCSLVYTSCSSAFVFTHSNTLTCCLVLFVIDTYRKLAFTVCIYINPHSIYKYTYILYIYIRTYTCPACVWTLHITFIHSSSLNLFQFCLTRPSTRRTRCVAGRSVLRESLEHIENDTRYNIQPKKVDKDGCHSSDATSKKVLALLQEPFWSGSGLNIAKLHGLLAVIIIYSWNIQTGCQSCMALYFMADLIWTISCLTGHAGSFDKTEGTAAGNNETRCCFSQT